MKKYLKLLFGNPGPKAVALVLATILYVAIMNISDPVTVRTINNVPVTVTNASYVESMGLSYRLASDYETVSVRVRGNNSQVNRLTTDDITVKADLTRIVSFESTPIVVPLQVTALGVGEEYVTSIPSTVQIEIEELVSR
ncbi:MAG: hypothetical protein KBS83_02500, partial [Lachnospiraceae bacterium]|nr:hypothetical protein [Candidatus Equihabitans merdae]